MNSREAEPVPLLAGVVLCGGRSRRMGTDKALLVVDGERLVDRAARRLRLVADPVLLACGSRPLHVPGCAVVDDAALEGGPLAGIVAGLGASPHRRTAVVAVDMPWLDLALLARLAMACTGAVDAAVPVAAGRLQPLHAVYAQSALPTMRDALAAGELRLRDVLEHLRLHLVDTSDGSPDATRYAVNVNRPEDLLSLQPPPQAGA